MAAICKQCFVSGRVQGVSFRYYTQKQAKQLGVTGYAYNLTDGRVEVLACGETTAVNALCDWLQQGSPQAVVQAVACETITGVDIPTLFEIG